VGHYAAWSYFQSVPGERNEAFIKAYRAKYGAESVVTAPMEAAYAGVHMWAQAVEKAGETSPAAVRAVMRSMTYEAPGGALRIDASTGHSAKFARVGRIEKGGQFKLVYASVEPIESEPYPASRTKSAWETFLGRLQKEWDGQWAAPVASE
jgi:urea transport system substrate-binding protein